MIAFFHWFVKITGFIPERLVFGTKVYYQDKSVQSRRIKGKAIVVCNHQSIFDFATLMFVFPSRTLRALAAEVVERLLRPQVDAIVARLRRAQQVGQIPAAADPAIVAQLLIGPVFHRWLLRTGPLDTAFADAIVDHTVGTLGPASTGAEPT